MSFNFQLQSHVVSGVVATTIFLSGGSLALASGDSLTGGYFSNPETASEDTALVKSLNSSDFSRFYRVPSQKMTDLVKRASTSPGRAVDIVLIMLKDALAEQDLKGSYARVSLVEVMQEAARNPMVIDIEKVKLLGRLIWQNSVMLDEREDRAAVQAVADLYIQSFVSDYAKLVADARQLKEAVEFFNFLSFASSDGELGLQWISAKRRIYSEAREVAQSAIVDSVSENEQHLLTELYDLRDPSLNVLKLLQTLASFDSEKAMGLALIQVADHVPYRDSYSNVLPEISFIFAYGTAEQKEYVIPWVISFLRSAYVRGSMTDYGLILDAMNEANALAGPRANRAIMMNWEHIQQNTYPMCTQAAALTADFYQQGLTTSEEVNKAVHNFANSDCMESWEAKTFLAEAKRLCLEAREQGDAEVFASCNNELVPTVWRSIYDLAQDPARNDQLEILKKSLEEMMLDFN